MTEAPRAPRILICDDLDPAALEVLRVRGFEPEVRTGLKGDALLAAVADVDAVIVRSATHITRPVIEAAERLAVIGRAGIGVDNIDCTAATERGIVVMNTPLGNATTTAELAITLLLALARHIPRADRMARSGTWKKKGLVGTEVTGKTLGVIGLGRIGRLVAERGRGLGMAVVGHDPYLDVTGGESPVPGVELLELDDLLARADFVTLHVPLTDATRNLLSWERFAKMKRGARLVQASRGGIVDEEALLDALSSGRLAGAALDVFAQEPPPADHPLLARDDVIVTPHLGASSTEAQLRVAVDMAEQIADFLTDGVARNAVNAPTLSADARVECAPFLVLAEKIGAYLAQVIDGPIRKLELSVSGAVARHGIEHLRLALLVGVLRQSLDATVNFVNAPVLAKERGILVLERSAEAGPHAAGLVAVRATQRAGEASHLIEGTVLGRIPRFVRIDHTNVDLPTSGSILVTRHRDQPGVLGAIGTLLGEHKVNIRRLEVGPATEGEDAYGFLTLYGEPPAEALEAIRGLDAINEARLVRL